ncbi:DUF485 domain-containing protein [Parafrankia sp. BMG5.11]|uniref:DUF485 domain-containing protein n=1 Tax=Parafrankia sp. BMG5.11 TaxID=222540 RepID=UPI00103E6E62|nr:DUF485 domain-containing protein [Parafrankia sp. BMG5.11]TCJ41408.1 DUF485 domain-containing protein [Parafrankia sp. BMG5.11]
MAYNTPLDRTTSSSTLAENPKFQMLTRERARLGWTLSIAILIIFFGFILLVAFAPAFLAKPVAAGWTMTIGIPMGIGVILSGIALTALYVRRANGRFDQLTNELRREAGQ